MILAVETHRNKSIGTLLRCASAFGASCVIVVGSAQYSTHGAHGAQNHVEVIHFYYWRECIDYCRNLGYSIYSISPSFIVGTPEERGTTSVDSFIFKNTDSCFIVGERDSLTTEQKLISDVIFHVDIPCMHFEDKVVYDSKVAICLQQYAATVGLDPRTYENEKHVLGERDFRRAKTVKAGRDNARTPLSTEGGDEDELLGSLFSE